MPRYFATSISAKGKLMHEKTSIISLLNQNNVQLYIVHPSGHVSVYGTAIYATRLAQYKQMIHVIVSRGYVQRLSKEKILIVF